MTDVCVVSRPSLASGELDPDTWLPADTVESVVYEGVCRFRMPGTVSASRTREVSGDMPALSEPVLSVPIGSARLAVGDVAVITAVPDDDPGGHLRLGLRMRVIGLVLGTHMTSQRVTVQVVTG